MPQLNYSALDPETIQELRGLLPDFDIGLVPLDEIPAGDIVEIAKSLAQRAWLSNHTPSLTILSDFYFEPIGSQINVSGLRELRFRELSAFCQEHAGREGLLRIVFAFTRDGREMHVDQRDVAGKISAVPSANPGQPLDRCWIPNGYQRPISDLVRYQPQLNRRERAYRIVGTLLGAATAQDIFEAHITVELPANRQPSYFRQICAEIGVKAIHIELPSGETPSHFITGSLHSGSFQKVTQEVERLAGQFEISDLKPTRWKIEAMVQNDAVPLSDEAARARPYSNYFEFHTKVTLLDYEQTDSLNAVCNQFGAHLARSASNKFSSGATQRFVTLRFHNEGRHTADAVFENLLTELRLAGYAPAHILKEYVVLDTNLDLDAGWADSAIPAFCFTNCEQLASNECLFQQPVPNAIHQGLVLLHTLKRPNL
jgi:hypothetical protein